jgi:hypothetical protein
VTANEQPRIGGKALQLTATLGTDGQLAWACGATGTEAIDLKYLPASCR